MNAQASQTTRHTIPLGGTAGIPISPDYLWFLIFGLLAWLLATQHFPAEFPGWSPFPFFGSVLLRELGHSAVALRYGIPIRNITLFIFGGVPR